jgi:hypothetical protein
MWLYLGSSYLDRSFSEEFSKAEINTLIHKALDHVANLNPGAGHVPLREGVASTRVSLFGSVLAARTISSSHHTRDLAHGLGGASSASWGISLSKDVVK